MTDGNDISEHLANCVALDVCGDAILPELIRRRLADYAETCELSDVREAFRLMSAFLVYAEQAHADADAEIAP
jgi:hypothetical protein